MKTVIVIKDNEWDSFMGIAQDMESALKLAIKEEIFTGQSEIWSDSEEDYITFEEYFGKDWEKPFIEKFSKNYNFLEDGLVEGIEFEEVPVYEG